MTPSTTALQDVFTGKVNFMPNGYWSYEVYEVSWVSPNPSLSAGEAPITETDVLLPPANSKGVVQGLVELGKLYIKEPTGGEEVQYDSYTRPAQTNYVYVS